MSAWSGPHSIPKKAFAAGFWLIGGGPFIILTGIAINSWIPHTSDQSLLMIFILFISVSYGTFRWAYSLLRRSGLDPVPSVGILAIVFFLLSIFGAYVGGYDLIFGNIMKLLNVQQTEGGTHPEFYVVFVTWTGIVTGSTALGVGLGLKRPRLAFKLFLAGLFSGALIFFVVALVMELFGFKVGTPRPDGIPSMLLVTALGVSAAALVGSEVLGRILARDELAAGSPDPTAGDQSEGKIE